MAYNHKQMYGKKQMAQWLSEDKTQENENHKQGDESIYHKTKYC